MMLGHSGEGLVRMGCLVGSKNFIPARFPSFPAMNRFSFQQATGKRILEENFVDFERVTTDYLWPTIYFNVRSRRCSRIVWQLPHFMNNQIFTTVRTTRTSTEAGLLINILKNAGLHPVTVDIASNFSVAGAEIEYPVRVPTAEAAEAREVLNAFDKPTA